MNFKLSKTQVLVASLFVLALLSINNLKEFPVSGEGEIDRCRISLSDSTRVDGQRFRSMDQRSRINILDIGDFVARYITWSGESGYMSKPLGTSKNGDLLYRVEGRNDNKETAKVACSEDRWRIKDVVPGLLNGSFFSDKYLRVFYRKTGGREIEFDSN